MDTQDIRKMGSLNLFLPFTYLVFLFGSLSLMAFPFTSGWYSKDLLIELLIVPNNFTHTIAYIFTLLGAFLTSSYSVRVMMMVMLNRPNFPKTILNYVIDSNYLKTLPLLFISIGAVTFGYLFHELFLAYGSTFYFNAIFIHPITLSSTLDAQFGGSLLALVSILFLFFISILFFISPFSRYYFNSPIITPSYEAHKFTNIFNSFNHNDVINHWIMYRYLLLSNILYRYIDKGLLELFGPIGGKNLLHFFGFSIELLSTGFIPHYALMKILSLFIPLIMIYFLNWNIILLIILILINFLS
jgi:NADH-ubiquinone oxidoreductase chain 5